MALDGWCCKQQTELSECTDPQLLFWSYIIFNCILTYLVYLQKLYQSDSSNPFGWPFNFQMLEILSIFKKKRLYTPKFKKSFLKFKSLEVTRIPNTLHLLITYLSLKYSFQLFSWGSIFSLLLNFNLFKNSDTLNPKAIHVIFKCKLK